MNILAFFRLLTVCVNLVLLIIVAKRFWNSNVGRAYLFLVLVILTWSVGDAITTLAPNREVAGLWEWVGEISSVFMGPFFLRFVFILTKRHSKGHIWLIRMLFLLSGVLTLVGFNRGLIVNEMVRTPLGYQADSAWGYYVLSIYVALTAVSAVVFAALSLRKLEGLKKRQMQLFLIAFSIPLVGGIVSEVIYPILNSYIIPLTTPLLGATGIVIVYAIGKYQFLSITPSIAYETVFNTVSDALIVINATESIELINDAAKTILGYEKAELVGKPLSLVLKGSGTADVNSDHILHEHLKNTEMIFLPKDPSKQIPVQINSSPIVVEGDPQGAVLAIRDISRMKELIVNLEQRSKELDKSKTDLEVQLHEVKRMNELMLGREKKMIELKKQIETLNQELQKPIVNSFVNQD